MGGRSHRVGARGHPGAVRGQRGQALPLALALALVLLLGAGGLALLGGARLAKARAQSAADTAALSAGRRLDELLPRIAVPSDERRDDLSRALARAAQPAVRAVGGRLVGLRLAQQGGAAWPPRAVELRVAVPGPRGVVARATARASLPSWAPGAAAVLPAWVPAERRAQVWSAALANGVPPALLAAVLQVESGFDPAVTSPAGARGIAQLMPGTAASLGVADPLDAEQAIPGAARLLARHLEEFGSPALALAAYNAGPGAVRRYGGVPPFAETQAYVPRVLALVGGAARPELVGGVVLVRAGDALA
jgi:soluble lytic murein transglycosylase-like protein